MQMLKQLSPLQPHRDQNATKQHVT